MHKLKKTDLKKIKEKLNLIYDYSMASDLEKAQKLYDEIAILAEAHKDGTEITLAKAKGAVYLLTGYGTAGNLAKAKELYEEVKALAEIYKKNDVIAMAQAKGASNLLSDYGKAGDLEKEQELYEELVVLAEDHKDNEAIVLAEANGTVNLMSDYGEAGNLERAQELYDELVALAGAHKDNSEIVLAQAEGAIDFISYYGEAGDIEKAQGIYDGLVVLAGAHKDNSEIVLAQALGAITLINNYGTAGDLEKARELYEQLVDLAASNKDNAKIVLVQAKGAVDLINDYSTAGDLEKAKKLYDELVDLAESNKDNAEIVLEQAKGAFNIAISYHSKDYKKKALIFYSKTKQLSKGMSTSEGIEVHAKANSALKMLQESKKQKVNIKDHKPLHIIEDEDLKEREPISISLGTKSRTMKIQYELSDYHKRIILLLGDSDNISPKDLKVLMKEIKRPQLDLLRGMSSDASSFLKTQIILKCRAEAQAEEYKAKMPEDKPRHDFGPVLKDFSLLPVFGKKNKVIESIREHKKYDEIVRELKGLEFLGIIKSSLDAEFGVQEFAEVLLTDYGRQIYNKLLQERNIVLRSPPSLRSSIFIASALGYEEIDKLYYNYLKPLCESLNYNPVRIDFKEPNNTITQAILESITETKAIIADLTFARPSVYFEVGFAQGIGVPLLITCRKDHYRGVSEETRVHFDLEQYKISFWEYTAEQKFAWGEKMAPDIRLKNILKDN